MICSPIAHSMESSGKPDQVHVSEETCGFLGDSYIIEEGEEVDGKIVDAGQASSSPIATIS